MQGGVGRSQQPLELRTGLAEGRGLISHLCPRVSKEMGVEEEGP